MIKVKERKTNQKNMERIEKYIAKYFKKYKIDSIRQTIACINDPEKLFENGGIYHNRYIDQFDKNYLAVNFLRENKEKLPLLEERVQNLVNNLENQVAEILKTHPKLIFAKNNNGDTLATAAMKFKLLKIVDLYVYSHSEILTMQNEQGKNFGMIAADNQIEYAVIEALKHPEASIQLDDEKMNIGMYAAKNRLINATNIALDNITASTQQEKFGSNIGMIAITNGLGEDIAIKAISNKKAATQLDMFNENMGMKAAKKKYEKATLKALDNSKAASQVSDYARTIGMCACRHGLHEATMKAISLDKDIFTRQSYNGKTIGMYAAENKMEDIVLMALDFEKDETLKDESKRNLGMYAAQYKLEKATLTALDYHKASLEQDEHGMTIGMYAGQSGLKDASIKAVQNKEALKLHDKNGWDLAMYTCKQTGDKQAAKRVKEYYDELERERIRRQQEKIAASDCSCPVTPCCGD